MVLVVDDAVRDIRVHGHRVLDAIVVAVRDGGWGTYPATVTSRDRSLYGIHGDVFSWTGRLEVSADTVHFGLRGRVLRDFDSQRVGICLLHPPELAGHDFRTDVGAGTFGVSVDPSVLATGFRSLSYDVGCPVDITLDGPPFEMEDHRNWSDPGWKSYCPPLGATTAPRRWRAGEEVVQAVTVRGRPSVVPAVGRYGTDLRDVVEGGSTVDLPPAGPLSVALVGRTRSWLTDTAARLARRGGPTRVAVFDPSTHTTTPGSAPLVRSVLRDLGCDAPVGGGSRVHLAELNRLDADPGEWDFCTFPVTAQAHHSDTASVLATVRAQPAMMARARRMAPGLPIVVGPLAFRRRQGANAPAAPHDPPDPREREPLCAAWLLGSVLGLRGAGALAVLLEPAPATDAVVRALNAVAGRPFVDLPTGRPDVLAATVLGAAPVTLVANLGTEPVTVRGRSVAGYGVAFVEGEP